MQRIQSICQKTHFCCASMANRANRSGSPCRNIFSFVAPFAAAMGVTCPGVIVAIQLPYCLITPVLLISSFMGVAAAVAVTIKYSIPLSMKQVIKI